MKNFVTDKVVKSKVNTFLVGFPKSGTTSLAHWLSESKNVESSTPKETFNFCTEFNDIHP